MGLGGGEVKLGGEGVDEGFLNRADGDESVEVASEEFAGERDQVGGF